MSNVLRRKCFVCENVYDVIPEEVYFSEEAKDGVADKYVRGVRFVTNAFDSEVWNDKTKRWYCNRCWWQGWWDI